MKPKLMQDELIKAETYIARGDLKQAETIYLKYLSFDPENPSILHILGLISYHTGKLDNAVDLIQKAIKINPEISSFHRSIADTYQDLDRIDDAIDAYKNALGIKPDCCKSLINMGNAFHKKKAYTQAIACFKKTVSIDPDNQKAYNNIGKTLQDQGCVENALAYYEKALALHTHYPEARFNRSTALLLLGKYAKGFKDFEYRFVRSESERIYPHQFDKPRWDGSTFFGKKLFVHSEQGFGDTIQFARYLPMLKSMGGTVIFETFKPLLNIFKSFPGVDKVVKFSFEKKPDASFDCYIPLLSLPAIFKTTLKTIPNTIPYLFSTSEKKAYWKKKISKTGFNIGLVWSGKPTHGNDKNRSLNLIQFKSLFDIPGVNIYGLQKEKTSLSEKENLFFQNTTFTNLANAFIDFTDTAGAIENLDLTITVDTSVAHLAGAMGKPVWLLLPFVPDWRWLLNRDDSPWYPTMKLFRQKTDGNWDTVIEEIKQNLNLKIDNNPTPQPVSYEKKPSPDTCENAVYFFNQANTLYDSQRPDEAIYCYQIALKLNPFFQEACFNLAKAYHDLDQTDMAIIYYKKACEIHPAMFESYYNLGTIYQKKQKINQAISCYQKTVEIKPEFFEAHNNLGSALQEQGHFHAAQLSYENALKIKPDHAEALYNLGNLFQNTFNYKKAVSNYIKAIKIKPDYSKASGNMGRCYHLLGDFHAAEGCFNRALSIDPDYVEAKFNLSITHLLTGNFAKGWKGYEWRLDKKLSDKLYPHSYSVSRWDGSSFEGKTLLVHSEQGIGDSLQFSRYLPWVKKRGGTVIFETRKSLLPLFKNFPGIDILLQQSEEKKPDIHFDYYIPLLSLPGLFNTDIDNLPSKIPYIHADPEKKALWKKQISDTSFNIGVVWSGNNTYPNRSCHFNDLLPLFNIDGVKIYGLQKSPASFQAKENHLSKQISFVNFDEELVDFSDTAAVISHLDLVISIDTSVAHLAGAMGKNVWVLLPDIPDWRWLLNRNDSPWYPTMRLFRQKKQGDWKQVIDHVVQEIKKEVYT